MKLGASVLSVISQKKINSGWSYLYVKSKKVKLMETETRMVVVKAER